MKSVTLKQINRLATHNDDAFHHASTRLGDIWTSKHMLEHDASYQTQLPSGLHIGSGFATIESQLPSLGRFMSQGASFNLVQIPEGFEEKFSTRIGKGHGYSGGLHLAEGIADYPDELAQLLEKIPSDTPFMLSHRIPYHIVHRLSGSFEDDWYQGQARRLLQEAKAYEYLAVAVTLLTGKETPVKLAPKRYVQEVKDLIDIDPTNLPTLRVMAQMAATNVRSLTHAFRETYGCSIHAYITQSRMQKAIELLEEGYSVSETAHNVGYSLGHFSQKFQAYYGFSASIFLKK